MRCPSCNKFAAYDTSGEPEMNIDSDISQPDPESKDLVAVSVTGDVRIVLSAECCGDELKEYNFDISEDMEIERAEGCDCDLTDMNVDVSSVELTERVQSTETRQKKDGTVVTRSLPARAQKRFYGYSGQAEIKCACGKTKDTIELGDEVQASSMDELT